MYVSVSTYLVGAQTSLQHEHKSEIENFTWKIWRYQRSKKCHEEKRSGGYGLPASTLSTLIKNEAEILQRYVSSNNLSCKRQRQAEFPDLEEVGLSYAKSWKNFQNHWNRVLFEPAIVGWEILKGAMNLCLKKFSAKVQA